jgi:hypothetical protein
MADAADRLAAALADRYSIERELGVGGMATVYLAEDLKHQRKVAINLPDTSNTVVYVENWLPDLLAKVKQ